MAEKSVENRLSSGESMIHGVPKTTKILTINIEKSWKILKKLNPFKLKRK